MQKLNIRAIHQTILAKQGGTLIQARILGTHRVNKNLSKILVEFSDDSDRQSLTKALANRLGAMATPVGGTFVQVASDANIYEGYVAYNPEVREMPKSAQAAIEGSRETNFRVMAKNLLLDEEDQSLWEARESASGKFLVRTSKEDLSELLSSVVTASAPEARVVQQHWAQSTVKTNPTEFVAFMDRDTAEVGYGYVVESTDNTARVLAFGADEDAIEVPMTDIIQSVALEGEDRVEGIEVPASASDVAALKNYYKQLYGKNPTFFNKLAKAIDSLSKI